MILIYQIVLWGARGKGADIFCMLCQHTLLVHHGTITQHVVLRDSTLTSQRDSGAGALLGAAALPPALPAVTCLA